MKKLHKNSQKRFYDPGFTYFVTCNTFQKFPYFLESIFCELFIEELKLCKRVKGFELFAFCLLKDHFHFVVKPGEKANISKIMQFLKRHTSRNINIILNINSEGDNGHCRLRPFQFILERLEHFLKKHNAVAEMFLERRIENMEPLQSVFHRLKTRGNGYVSGKSFQTVFLQDSLIFVGKENIGAQIADLAIYPITTKVFRTKENKAFDVLAQKFYGGNLGNTAKYGFKIFP